MLGKRLLAHRLVACQHAQEPGLGSGETDRGDALTKTFGGRRADLGEEKRYGTATLMHVDEDSTRRTVACDLSFTV